ncbi:hypothetical protein GCM10010218_20030 [Streptomyces mashuensis]|uniref:Uncharacterized protein n=1 Tax=Streptomyces mashuensis TaxID=33904 RepID=A0A919EC81_9ACTN|nr:hypothetical protein [Streptomyces mashuensis]GHF38786.1 hypothetical protein GCM10010218_20030 [Streptomyces mashuensis]
MKYQCETFQTIKSELQHEAAKHAKSAQEHTDDRLARWHSSLVVTTKRYMVRKLETHVRRCGLCA